MSERGRLARPQKPQRVVQIPAAQVHAFLVAESLRRVAETRRLVARSRAAIRRRFRRA